jgi:carbon-monoxide dehydrogenase medium subunit
MYDFVYKRASSVLDAVDKLTSGGDAKLLAGGMTLIPTLKQRLAQPTELIDLNGIAELVGVTVSGNVVTIGAMTRHVDVARNPDVNKLIPAVAKLATHIGDPAVRNRGTIGGSVANNDPSADYPSAVLALDATIKTDRREIKADDFFVSIFETALELGEIIVSVSFPVPEKAAYIKFPNPASRYAMVGVFVAKSTFGARVAVTGAGPVVFRQTEMEAALSKNWSPDAVANIKQSQDGLNTDIHASAEYRAHLVTAMVKRAVAAAG